MDTTGGFFFCGFFNWGWFKHHDDPPIDEAFSYRFLAVDLLKWLGNVSKAVSYYVRLLGWDVWDV
jgi:hypothetical protein